MTVRNWVVALGLLAGLAAPMAASAGWIIVESRYLPGERCGPDASWLLDTHGRAEEAKLQLELAGVRFGYGQHAEAEVARVQALLAEQDASVPPPAGVAYGEAVAAMLQAADLAVYPSNSSIDLIGAVIPSQMSSGPPTGAEIQAEYEAKLAAEVWPLAAAVDAARDGFLAECGPDVIEPDGVPA